MRQTRFEFTASEILKLTKKNDKLREVVRERIKERLSEILKTHRAFKQNA